jgi:regulator of telomere elongation helicase 1
MKSSSYVPQIIYTSRTHQQLKQVVGELKRFPFCVNMTVLSSREQTCVNVDLKELKGKDKGFECRKRLVNANQ